MQKNATVPRRDRRRSKALIGLVLVALLVGTLIYFGQVEVIYVLSTLALIALLLLVGFSDLEKVGNEDSNF